MIKYNIKNKSKTIKCVEFDGLIEQLKFITPQVQNNVYGIVDEIKESSEHGWNGKRSLNKTLDGMRYGFQKETDYFLDNVESIRSNEGLDGGLYMDVEGFAYDMGSVVQGVPECCINMGLPTPTPCVPIMVDLSFSCWVSSDAIYNRGIAITNLVNTLLLNGYIVDLYFMLYNVQHDMDIMATVKIDTKSLPISDIAFLCSTDYFRKICFITMDAVRGKQSEGGRGQSSLCDFMINKFKKDDIFFIGGSFNDANISSHLNTVKEANKYLLDNFKLYCDKHKIRICFNNSVDTNG